MTINVVTHNGKFHPDEIFACVFLGMYHMNDKLKFIRTRDEELLRLYKNSKDFYVIDVGDECNPEMLNFDHHQASFVGKSKNGDPLSSCGLMWEFLKQQNLGFSDFVMNKIDEFVNKVDRHDNGIEYYPELDFITLYNYGENKQNKNFKKAYKVAVEYFTQLLYRWNLEDEADQLEDEVLKNSVNKILYSDTKMSISPKLNRSNNLLLVTERAKNEYTIISLNSGHEIDFSVRCPAPLEWAGLSGEEIEAYDKRLVFCHKNRFITVVKGTKEDAIEIANKIVYNHHETIRKNDQLLDNGCGCGL